MIVTINTDASFSDTHKIGTYAFWIVCNEGRILRSGAFKDKVHNPTEAEVKCIVNAMQCLYSSDFSGITKVVINTDCLYFKGYTNNNKKTRPENKEWDKVTIRMVKKFGLKKGWLSIRHVKAHSGTAEKRKFVNDWCDKEAKKVLREWVNGN